jgi:CheY-like chemotaxis protein
MQMGTMKRVLLVEDDLVIARIYRRKLEEAGLRVRLAEDGLAAIRLIPEFGPDLVVLDIMLPRLNGVDVLRWVRENPDTRFTRVVVLSNAFLNEIWDKITGLGVQEILLKSSVGPPQLVRTVLKLLDQPAPTAPAPAHPHRPVPHADLPAPAPPAIHPPATAEPTDESVLEFGLRMRHEFLDQIPAIAASLKAACHAFLDGPDVAAQLIRLEDLRRKAGFLTHMTAMAGWHRIAQLSNALEALLYELQLKPEALVESSRHTIATAVELLAEGLQGSNVADEQCQSPAYVLIVDDDAVSARTLVTTLARGDVTAVAVADPFQALEKLRQTAFDIVLLDINLPGMSGLALGEQLRQLPLHRTTPLIFITSYSELGPQAHSILVRGDDLIGKPIMPIELTVRVMARIFERRLTQESPSAA